MTNLRTPEESRVGWQYNATDGSGQNHRVISDTSAVEGCVTVENGAGQCFPVERSLVDMFATPPGMTWCRSADRYVPAGRAARG